MHSQENTDLVMRFIINVNYNNMKTLFLGLILCTLSSPMFAQSKDSVLYDYQNIRLTKNLENNRYKLTNKKSKEKFENLKFVRRIAHYFQVLDENNKMFYIGEDWKKEQEVHDFFGLCGSVPTYTLTVNSKGTYFEVLEDETFYDQNNEIPAEVISKINKNDADVIVFVNGKNNFTVTGNFSEGIVTTHPRMLILIKDGKYFTQENPNLKFDAIDFSNYGHSLKTKKNNLYGLLGIIEPKYKRIEKFKYYLAIAETQDEKIVYIDTEGNEY